MSDAWTHLPGNTGDAWNRMCGTSGDSYSRLSGSSGDTWNRLIQICGGVIAPIKHCYTSFVTLIKSGDSILWNV